MLTKEELLSYKKYGYLTIGILKEYIKEHPNLSDDSLIVVQRIEDFYYENNNWKTYNKEDMFSHQARQWNKDVLSGKYLDKENYPLINENDLKLISEEDIMKNRTQYSPIHCPVNYKDDQDILFLDLHH